MILPFLLGVSLAAPPLPSRPAPPDRVEGECRANIPISRGRPLPDTLVSPSVLAKCSAVAAPLSNYADLLATELWAEAISKRYTLDVALLEQERDWYKATLEAEVAPKPFMERPSTQRWFGRVETLIVVGVVAATMSVTYQYTVGE